MVIRTKSELVGESDKYRQKEFRTGRMLEGDVFGVFTMSQAGERAFKAAAADKGYIDRDQVMILIRRYTTEDPTNPRRPFANELRLAVIDKLGLRDKDMDRVKFYTAIKTPLDIFHGIDAWIEFTPERGEPVVVTLDVTENSKKIQNKNDRKADILVAAVPDPEEDQDEFMRLVYEEYAPEIADKFRAYVSRKGSSNLLYKRAS